MAERQGIRADLRAPARRPAARAPQSLTKARLPFLAALYLLCIVVPLQASAGSLQLSLLRILLLLTILPLLWKLFSGAFGRLIAPDFLFLAHAIWASAALLINSPEQAIQQIGSVETEFLGGYLIGRAAIRSQSDFLGLCRWMMLLVLSAAPFALIEAKTGTPPLLTLLDKIPAFSVPTILYIEGRMGLERVQMVFAHPIHYGLFCSVAFSLVFVALKGVISEPLRYIGAAVIGASGFLALSSGAILAVLLQMALIGWFAVFARYEGRWWLLLGLFALAYIGIDLLSNRTPLRVFMSYATFSAHTAYWRSIIFEWGMKNIWANPWFGLGLRDWVRPYYMYSGSMDNFWLVMGVRYGILGFLTVAAGYIWYVWRQMTADLAGRSDLLRLRRALVFTFCGLAFTLCTVHVWTNIYSFVFFLLGASTWLLFEEPAQTAPQESPESAPAPKPNAQFSRFAPTHQRRK